MNESVELEEMEFNADLFDTTTTKIIRKMVIQEAVVFTGEETVLDIDPNWFFEEESDRKEG